MTQLKFLINLVILFDVRRILFDQSLYNSSVDFLYKIEIGTFRGEIGRFGEFF